MFQTIKTQILILLCFGFNACQADPEYLRLAFIQFDSSPTGYKPYVNSDQITLRTGIVQEVEAVVEFKGDQSLIGSFVELSSQNQSVFGILSTGKKNHFLLIGKSPGQTCMNVVVNGVFEECINATIEP